jgi:hypothetical protein
MAKKTGYQGHRSQWRAPVNARSIISGAAPGVAGTRERRSVAKPPSLPAGFKSPGVNGTNWARPEPQHYHTNAGMGPKTCK